MNVVITMAGNGTRFKEQGIDEKEKWELQIKDKTMFEWAMASLEAFFDEKFIFIAQKDHEAEEFIQEKCKELGIGDWNLIEVSEKTDGQATTALLAEKKMQESEEFAVYNIDTYVEKGEIRDNIDSDGCIPVFEAGGEKWSFVKTDKKGNVVDVAEKKRISNLATLGFYHFGSLEDFKKAYSEMREEVKEEYGEVYIAPLYNWFIENDRELSIQRVNPDKIHVLGTPEDVKEFWPKFEELYDDGR
jgi:dTDP-glucose pyrophosphorylase